jgi:ssDNA-binding Zn-finger/Zn-ribbon topoisomerase 1
MIAVKLKTNLIDKSRIFRGRKHNYLDLVLIENRNGRDDYGFDGYIKCRLTAEELDADPRPEMPIIGNWTRIERKAQPQQEAPALSRANGPASGGGNLAEEDYPF